MRLEFSRKTRAIAFERCKGLCDGCGARLKVGEAEYDHVLPAALGGNASAENCQVLCKVCHRGKTTTDVQRIRKADRQRDRASGAIVAKQRIKSAGFPHRPRPQKAFAVPAPKKLFAACAVNASSDLTTGDFSSERLTFQPDAQDI